MKTYDFGSRIKAQPLVTARADEASSPYVVEVSHGQWEGDPGRKTLVVKVQVRPGVDIEHAKSVFQHAVIDVLGERVPAPRLLDWYNPAAASAGPRVLALVSLTLILFPGVIHRRPDGGVERVEVLPEAETFIAIRRPATIRDMVAAALGLRHGQQQLR